MRYLNGTPWNGKARPYYITSGDATALFIGDPVVIVGDSNDNEVQGFPAGTLSEITRASAADGSQITGIVTGILPETQADSIYRAASTNAVVLVVDDPNVVFEVQDDGTGTLTQDTVGLNAILAAGTGSTISGQSGFVLDGGGSTAPSADQSNQLYIMNLSNREDNEMADYAVWDVLINTHTFHGATTGRVLGVA